ncbi:hypothetical protein QCA50_014080 [Cerrena zonata]|uniref:Uncharacterized protein n=1 Tax=Cerrena zonata TaxID=2478898 RepID=A0AAW0FTR6_9APHY
MPKELIDAERSAKALLQHSQDDTAATTIAFCPSDGLYPSIDGISENSFDGTLTNHISTDVDQHDRVAILYHNNQLSLDHIHIESATDGEEHLCAFRGPRRNAHIIKSQDDTLHLVLPLSVDGFNRFRNVQAKNATPTNIYLTCSNLPPGFRLPLVPKIDLAGLIPQSEYSTIDRAKRPTSAVA